MRGGSAVTTMRRKHTFVLAVEAMWYVGRDGCQNLELHTRLSAEMGSNSLAAINCTQLHI
jgi:hypothetical protein